MGEFWRRHWHWVLGPLGWLAGCGFVVLAWRTRNDNVQAVGAFAGIGMLVCSPLWFCWVCPVLAARGLRPELEDRMFKRVRWLRVLTWIPGAVALGVAASTLITACFVDTGMRGFTVIVPLLVVCFTAGAVFAISIRCAGRVTAGARHAMLRQGLCVKCGYDLRGNPAGPCPECGTAVERVRDRTGGTPVPPE